LVAKTIYDPTLNRAKMYPPHRPSTVNQNISYSQIDIFYLIISNIETLSSQTAISSTSLEFQQLHDYLTPSYDQMVNATKYQFHETLQTRLSSVAL
jgi:hypothetical protein